MSLIGRYEILGTLGNGSMGTVYRARDTALGREIALKTIRSEESIDAELRERFYQEARTCARLHHPNIVTLFDLGEADGMMYIAMELLQGEDLRRIMDSRRPYSLEKKIGLMIEVCEGLDHAHSYGVIHRDIKPSNIFIVRDETAKVLDFGIARLPTSHLTRDGKVLGTPNYMSPEQILSQGCDGRSDLFAAAIVFFELVAGVHPFQGVFIPNRIASGVPSALRDINELLPGSLETVLARALQKDPGTRYQTGREFAEALAETLADARNVAVPDVNVGLFPEEEQTPEPPPPPPPPPVVEKQPPKTPLPEPPSTRPPGASPTTQKLDVTQIIDVGGRDTGGKPPWTYAAKPAPPVRPTPNPSLPPRTQPPAIPPRPTPDTTGSVWKIAAVFLASAVITGLVAYLIIASRRVAVLSAVGTADVIAAQAQVLTEPAANAKSLLTLKSGDRVNIVQATGPEKPVWLQVQRVSGAIASKPGYMRPADLGNWSTLALCLTFRPDDTATGAQRASFVADLEKLLAKTPTSPDTRRANLQIAEQSVMLARAAREAGKPAGEWLNRADRSLRAIRTEPGFAAVAEELRSSVEALRRAPPPPPEQTQKQTQQRSEIEQITPDEPPAGKRVERYDPEPDYRLAELDWQKGCYAGAERRLARILKLNPALQKASRLLETVRKAQSIDPGVCQP